MRPRTAPPTAAPMTVIEMLFGEEPKELGFPVAGDFSVAGEVSTFTGLLVVVVTCETEFLELP